jgi:hypothetical protein
MRKLSLALFSHFPPHPSYGRILLESPTAADLGAAAVGVIRVSEVAKHVARQRIREPGQLRRLIVAVVHHNAIRQSQSRPTPRSVIRERYIRAALRDRG